MDANALLNEALLLRPTEAARMLAVSPRSLWAMTKCGQVPHLRLGRSVRYSVDDLRRWIAERKQGGQSR